MMLKTSKIRGKSSSLNAIVHKAIVEAEGLLPLITAGKELLKVLIAFLFMSFIVYLALFGRYVIQVCSLLQVL